MNRYLSYETAAEFLDVSVSYLKKKISDGTFQIGRHYFKPDGVRGIIRFDAVELEKWIRRKESYDTVQQEREVVSDVLSRVRPDSQKYGT